MLFVLGIMHFFNLFLFSRFRRRALDRLRPRAASGSPDRVLHAADAGAMTRLTVVYDARCGLCCAVRDWLAPPAPTRADRLPSEAAATTISWSSPIRGRCGRGTPRG